MVSIFLVIATFSGNATTCTYQIKMWDTYGDGWDGEVRIQMNCGSGWANVTGWQSCPAAGPDYVNFNVDDANGCTYRLRYRDNGGLWPEEEFFEVYDGNGVLVLSGDGSGGSPQNFEFIPSCSAPTCSDGIQNQGETGIDCGGPCPACLPSCVDGIQNQGETGIDCGGPCGPCPTCNDGIQNQGETGIDCGGPCSACPVLCSDLGFENMASGANQILVTGWELLIGRNTVAGPYTIENEETHASGNCSANFTSHAPASYCGTGGSGIKVYHNAYQHHDIETSTTAGINDLVDVPNLPNFSGSNTRCMRLGGEQQIGMEASGMRTTITIADPYLVYHYILRFENTGHTINNRGFCTFRIKDSGGNILPCGSFEVYEDGPGETWSYDNGWDTWYMDDWKSVTMDVSDYIGQALTIEVWVADCQEGAHGGWGYFDFECLSSATPDCSVGPLPVELVEFNAACVNNNAKLNWTTLSEENNSSFTVLHSSDGDNFERVAKILGAGNTTETQHYTWTSTERYSGTQYFKLIQTDYDGKKEEFNTISYNPCNEVKASAYFDANNSLHIVGENIISATVLDAAGREVEHELGRFEKDELVINIPTVSTGIYLVSVTYSNNEVETVKVYYK